jgi:glycopeptide antibiotics resistance protein
MALRQGPGSHEFAVAIGNLAAFMPLGILLPLITRRRSLWQVIASGAALSAAVELAQLAISAFLGFGYRTADIDDLILNTIGAAMGFAALVLLGSIGRSDATARS